MGESHNQLYQLSLNRFLRVDFPGPELDMRGLQEYGFDTEIKVKYEIPA